MHERFPAQGEEFVDQYLRFREWLHGVSLSHVGRAFRTLVRVRLDVLDDTAAAGAKDSAAPAVGTKSSRRAAAGAKDRAAAAVGAKSSHWASPAVTKEAKDFTLIPSEGPRSHLQRMVGAVCLKWTCECAIRD